MLAELSLISNIKNEIANAGSAVKNDWQKVSTDLHTAGQMCGTNQLCQELASYGVNASSKIDSEIINNWMKNGTYGAWCAQNATCKTEVAKALTMANTKEAAAINTWLHPAALQNLSIIDDIKAAAAKAEAAAKAKAAAAEAAIKKDWQAVSTDLVLAGQKCGTNPICQELATYGVQVNKHIDVLVVKQWLKEGKYGQWCASNKVCMEAVNEAINGATKAERSAVNHWLHPAHTAESLGLMNLNIWDDIKNEAAKAEAAAKKAGHVLVVDGGKAIHAVEVAGQMCGSNKICTEIAQDGTKALESGETKMVMSWINSNQKASWCKSNTTCMAIVNKALAAATTEETHLIDQWLHQPSTLMNLNIWDDIKREAAKAEAAAKKAGHAIVVDGGKAIHAVEVAGQMCGSNKICTEIAQKGTQALESGETKMVMSWINSNQKASWCKSNTTCMAIVNKALSVATTEETHLINEWLHQPSMILMVI